MSNDDKIVAGVLCLVVAIGLAFMMGRAEARDEVETDCRVLTMTRIGDQAILCQLEKPAGGKR